MSPAATLGNSAWLAASAPAWFKFQQALSRPEDAQWRLLRGQLGRNARCAYGRAHGFREIRNYAEFAARVPIVSYDEIAPWVNRIMRGDTAVLTEAPVSHLMPTSGSTGGRKLIPFTAALQQEFNAGIGPWMIDLWRKSPSIALGPAYWSVTPLENRATPERSAVPIGFEDDAEYLGGARRRLVEATMAAPSLLRRVTDLATFRRLALLFLLRCEDLRLISVWHPSFLALLLETLPLLWDELLADIQTGGCADLKGVPAELKAALHLPPLPRRAAQLRSAKPACIEFLWPKLSVVSCWGDAHARLAMGDLARHIPQANIQPKGLLATEAFVTIPFAGYHPVALRSHFFEFIDEKGRIYPLHELREGPVYEVVVTTSGGLWRYRLGDQVEVNGFLNLTPSLRFLGRAGRISDRFGEKLSEAFVAHELGASLGAAESGARFAMLAADESSPGFWHYTLYTDGEPRRDLADRLEQALRLNPNYLLCRDLGQLHPLRVFKIDRGAYDVFVRAEMKQGIRLGDIKPTALSLRTDWSTYFSGDYVPLATGAPAVRGKAPHSS